MPHAGFAPKSGAVHYTAGENLVYAKTGGRW